MLNIALQIAICLLSLAGLNATGPAPALLLAPSTTTQDESESMAAPEPESDASAEITSAEELLDALDTAEAKLENFSAKILYRVEQGLLGDVQTRRGQLFFLNDRDTKIRKFRVEFRQLELGESIEQEDRDFIFDGRWLVERVNDEKQFLSREVVRPGEKFDALSVDGPFPLPIGQPKEDVLSRFTATLLPMETAGRLIGCYKLHLKPKAKIHADAQSGELSEESIEDLTLWYDATTLLPLQVVINETTGDVKTMKLVDVASNLEIDKKIFDTTAPGPNDGWRVTIERFDR